MGKRIEFPRKVRRAIIERAKGHCERCSAVLKPSEAEVDHILPAALGGTAEPANGMCLCRICHAEKTADDIRRIRKADRQRDRASGALKAKGSFPRRAKAARPKRDKLPVPPRRSIWRVGELKMPIGDGDTE